GVLDVHEPMVVEEYGVVRRGGGEGDVVRFPKKEVAEGRKCPVKRVQAPRPVPFSIFLAYPHATRDGRCKRQAGRTYGHHPHPGPALAATHKYTSRAPPPGAPHAPRPRLPVCPCTTSVRRASTETRADRHKHGSEGSDEKGDAWVRRGTSLDGVRTPNSASHCAKSAPKRTVRRAEEDTAGICMHGRIEKPAGPQNAEGGTGGGRAVYESPVRRVDGWCSRSRLVGRAIVLRSLRPVRGYDTRSRSRTR
ncbi:hypothetical protein B0H14DRAFT_2828879, partial [Mycena olivaceomarginata]